MVRGSLLFSDTNIYDMATRDLKFQLSSNGNQMKINVWFPVLFSALALISGCSDAVSDEYSTYAQAKEERLFDRGWLPDILPKSTVKIEVNNDLDVNT